MFNALRKRELLPEEYPNVRSLYDATYFNGRGLVTDWKGDGATLYNLLVQGEVVRLAVMDVYEETQGLHATQKAVLAETKALHATQKEILKEMRAARGLKDEA